MVNFNWKCPYCNHDSTVLSSNYYEGEDTLTIDNAIGTLFIKYEFIVCPNRECKKVSLCFSLEDVGQFISGKVVRPHSFNRKWTLLPESIAKTLPDYIPKPIIDDYNEACLIKDLSPKASATLSRRCLQTMIRDFWGVKGKKNLYEEIEAVKDKVNPQTWKAIGAVRNLGNIGAHMEEDINLIVNIDPNEANILIKLIETLIEDWYIDRYEREVRLAKIIDVNKKKEQVKRGGIDGNTKKRLT
jgi:hypothetical protein